MPYDVTVDPRQLLAACQIMEDQLPYAVSRSLNELATTFQSAERDVLQGDMTIRRPWVLQGVKIDRSDFSTKAKLVTRVQIDPARNFLNKFEDGGVKRPTAGLALSLPVNARRTKAQVVATNNRPRSFQFTQATSRLASQWAIYKGQRGTFMIQRPDGSGLILQRTRKPSIGPLRYGNRNHAAGRGFGQDPNLTVLWTLRPTTQTPELLHWGDTVKAVAIKWPDIFARWYGDAVRTATPRSR